MQNTKTTDKSAVTIAVTALKLLVICAFIAALVASVNVVTKDRIALNQKMNTAEALTEIYSDDGMYFSVDENGAFAVANAQGEPTGSCDGAEAELLEDIDAVYVIKNLEGNVSGYCVEASPIGFKDEVKMLVAVNSDGTAKGVKIVSLSDTKGIGDKVMNESFLNKFKNKVNGFSKNASDMKDIVIAGATRTSEPVTYAVDTALSQINLLLNGGNESAAANTDGGADNE